MSLTDKQIESITSYGACPKCGSPCQPEVAISTELDSQRRWMCSFNAEGEEHSRMEKCGWAGTIRDLVETALKRAGIEVAEPWRADKPPEGVFITVYTRRTNMVSVVQIVNYRLLNNSFGTLGTDWKWRPIGPNPFD